MRGDGLEPGKSYELNWTRVVGNRMTGQGWEEVVEAGRRGQGRCCRARRIPLRDARRSRRHPWLWIDMSAGDAPANRRGSLGRGRPASVPRRSAPIGSSRRRCRSTSASGPVGTTFTIHLKGVGWTETANIYHVVYDNNYTGYVCAFNSQGDVADHHEGHRRAGHALHRSLSRHLQGRGDAAEQFPHPAAHLCATTIRAKTCRPSTSRSK